jgi:hypothetical protein
VARFRFFRFDEALLRDLAQFQSVLDLFNHLLVQSGGDVDEALDMLRYLKQQGYLPEDFDVDDFAKRLEAEEYIEMSDTGARLTRKGERGIRKSALTYVFGALRKGEVGDHRVPREGEGREVLSEKRPWRFGDEMHSIDFKGSILNSYRRGAEGVLGGGLRGTTSRSSRRSTPPRARPRSSSTSPTAWSSTGRTASRRPSGSRSP